MSKNPELDAAIAEYLKKNLTIDLKVEGWHTWNSHLKISISLGKETITESSISIPEIKAKMDNP